MANKKGNVKKKAKIIYTLDELNELFASTGLSMREVEKGCGMSNNTLSRNLKGIRRMTKETEIAFVNFCKEQAVRFNIKKDYVQDSIAEISKEKPIDQPQEGKVDEVAEISEKQIPDCDFTNKKMWWEKVRSLIPSE